jgi:prepilin peptidase dependent protein B
MTTLSRCRGRGLSMVELMVGIAVGLFVVAGGIALFVSHLGGSRNMLLEARLNQDLRAAADLVARDIRRAGYWGDALSGTFASGSLSTTPVNPYRQVAASQATSTIEYQYSRDTTENGTVDNNEQFGFKLNGATLQFKTNGAPTWQSVTDPNIVVVTSFAIAASDVPVDVRDACARSCCSTTDVTAGTCATANIASGQECPRINVRTYQIRIDGQAAADSRIKRRLETRARVRNDRFSGVCPA